MGRRVGGRAVAIGALALIVWGALFVSGGSGVASAQSDQPVGDAQAVTLVFGATPPGALASMPPLAGLAFFAPTVQAGFFDQVSTQDETYTPASAGDELLFLSVDADSFAPPFGQTGFHYAAPQLSVTFADHSVSLPESPDGSVSGVAGSSDGADGAYYPGRWLVAVPKAAAVHLVAMENGFSQMIDLRSGARIGSVPTVLYRDRSGPLALDVQPNLAGQLVVTAGGSRVTFPVTVQEETLSFFNLSSAQAPAPLPASQAYLFVQLTVGTGTDQSGTADWYFDPQDTTGAVNVTVNGEAVAATIGPTAPDPGNTGEPFSGLFGVVVPATLTSARLSVQPPSGPSVYLQGPNDLSPRQEAVTASTPATFAVSFPPPQPPAPLSSPATTSATTSTTVSGVLSAPVVPAASGRKGSSSSDTWPVVGAAAGGATVVILAGVFISRRTKLVEPRPVEPKQLPAGPSPPVDTAAIDVDPVVAEDEAPATVATVVSVVEATSDPVGDVLVLPRLRLRILGRLEVQGTVQAIRRRAVLRALIVLALAEGRPIGSEELRYTLADSEEAELSASSVRSELSRLRRVLPEGLLPEREPGSGYLLSSDDVEVDWIVFRDKARRSAGLEGYDRVEMALSALELVRGPVLVHQSWFGIDSTVWDMNAEIDRFAADTAETALQEGRSVAAAVAARQGLLAVVGSRRLWELRVLAARAGSGESEPALRARAATEVGDDFNV